MKLYAVTHSPFAARVRLALRLKGVPYEQAPPPGGSTRSPEYLAINPIGKLPVLVLPDGTAIAESETIIDYLEDSVPQPSLLPAGAQERVRMRNAVRTAESYVVPAALRLFRQMKLETRDAGVVAAELAQLRNGLTLVEHFIDDAAFAVGGKASKADCILLPTVILCTLVGRIFDLPELVAEFPRLSSYVAKARTNPDMGSIWDETEAALRAFLG